MAVQETETPLPTLEEVIDDLCVYVQERTALFVEVSLDLDPLPHENDSLCPRSYKYT